MVIVTILYGIMLWLVFAKLKLVRWGWFSGTIALLIGASILSVFLALLNNLTPSGPVVVIGRVIEVQPNVTGQVTAIPVKPNVPVKSGTVLFQIDPAAFQFKVAQLEAAFAQAQQQAKQLQPSYEQANANVEALAGQLAYQTKRLEDLEKLARTSAATEFRV